MTQMDIPGVDQFPWYDLASPEEDRAEMRSPAEIIEAMRLPGWVTREAGRMASDILGWVHVAEAITTDFKQVRVQVQWIDHGDGRQGQWHKMLEAGQVHLCWHGSVRAIEWTELFRVDGVGLYRGPAGE